MTKPTVLIITHHYLPGWKTGGPIRTISNMVELLGDAFEFRILTSDRDRGDSSAYPNVSFEEWNNVGRAKVRYLSPKAFRWANLEHILRKTPHDMLYLNSVLAEPVIRVLILRRLGRIPRKVTIIAPRGHLDSGALSLKARKKYTFLLAARLAGLYKDVVWHASSDQEKDDVIAQVGNKYAANIHVIPNLVTDSPSLDNMQGAKKFKGELRLVFLSRISRKKGLHIALQALQMVQGRVFFDIYGPIEDETYWQECQVHINNLPPTNRVQYKGSVSANRVIPTLRGYHLFVLPTLGENFGHVIAEAFLAGCPVIISDRTPWKDIEEKGAGWIVPLSEPEQYCKHIQEMINMDSTEFHIYREHAAQYGNQATNGKGFVEETKSFLNTVAQTDYLG